MILYGLRAMHSSDQHLSCRRSRGLCCLCTLLWVHTSQSWIHFSASPLDQLQQHASMHKCIRISLHFMGVKIAQVDLYMTIMALAVHTDLQFVQRLCAALNDRGSVGAQGRELLSSRCALLSACSTVL